MDCSALKPKMEALVNGSLPAPDRALAEQHLSTCEGCRLELELVRAIGSQEQTPGGQAPPDWTLDRIFGPETAQAQSAPDSNPFAATPAPSPGPSSSAPYAPAPEPAAAPEFGTTQASSNSPGSEPPDAAPPSWDFEPADAKGETKPTEESLFFAEEALARRKSPDDKKASNFRVILWGSGGVVGAILLALSSWFVLHMAPQGDNDSMRGAAAPSASLPVTGGDSHTEGDGSTPPAEPAAEPGAAATPTPAPSPPVSASSVGQPPPLPDAARTTGTTATRQAPLGASQPPAHPVTPPVATSRRLADAAGHGIAPETSKSTAPEASTRSARAIEPPPEPDADEAGSTGTSDAPQPRTTTAPQVHGEGTTSPKAVEPPAVGKTPEEGTPQPEINSPIQRIHLATLAAAEQEDLAALRRLRGTWKSFMSKMGVGPDRARAKREYADCLWAIQSLTARRGDQKDALAAYREYLLSAPAGGADSQSVSRLRQLEDALSEKH
jgi:hypothetical protein